MTFVPLVENEVLKLFKRRRFRVVVLILVALIGVGVFGRSRTRDRSTDWRVRTQERVARMQGFMRSDRAGRMPATAQRLTRFDIARLQYHLDRDIDPDAVSGPLSMRGFANFSSHLLFPLLALIFASDIVSSEFTQGTIKLLLTRPVSRTRVLASKLAALVIAITLTIAIAGAVTYGLSSLAFGWRGFGAPILTGFRAGGDVFDASTVRAVVLWKDIVLAYGLAWFSALVVGVLGFLTSVLLRSTAAAMGTMFATLIAGLLLPWLAPTWEAQKYLFVTNLPLPDYYSGAPPPIAGITVAFAVAVLAVWAAVALIAAFLVFARRDVLA